MINNHSYFQRYQKKIQRIVATVTGFKQYKCPNGCEKYVNIGHIVSHFHKDCLELSIPRIYDKLFAPELFQLLLSNVEPDFDSLDKFVTSIFASCNICDDSSVKESLVYLLVQENVKLAKEAGIRVAVSKDAFYKKKDATLMSDKAAVSQWKAFKRMNDELDNWTKEYPQFNPVIDYCFTNTYQGKSGMKAGMRDCYHLVDLSVNGSLPMLKARHDVILDEMLQQIAEDVEQTIQDLSLKAASRSRLKFF